MGKTREQRDADRLENKNNPLTGIRRGMVPNDNLDNKEDRTIFPKLPR